MKGSGDRSSGVHRVIQNAEVPRRSIAVFWLGGPSIAFKSSGQRVYLVDPRFSEREEGGAHVGVIDVRPDVVFCTSDEPEYLDLSTLTHLASAYPEAKFLGKDEVRDRMIGRSGDGSPDGERIRKERVHLLEGTHWFDVRRLGMPDRLRIGALPGPEGDSEGSYGALLNFAGLLVGLVRDSLSQEAAGLLQVALRRRIDVLLWSMDGGDMEAAGESVGRLCPRYAIPFGYDRYTRGQKDARRFREMVQRTKDVKTYLFPGDYREGLVYTRIVSRRRERAE